MHSKTRRDYKKFFVAIFPATITLIPLAVSSTLATTSVTAIPDTTVTMSASFSLDNNQAENQSNYPFYYLSDLNLAGNQAIDFLNGITEEYIDPHGGAGYSRNREKIFGSAWKDTDKNGCDTRNDILRRDLTSIDLDKNQTGLQSIGHGKGVKTCPNATVYTGILQDPYTNTSINFMRGKNTSKAVQIDHVVPLAYAYIFGGWKLAKNGEKRVLEQFANDPLNLLAVDGESNQSKGAQGPSQWTPPVTDTDTQCRYALRFSAVIEKYYPYGISVSSADKQFLINTITQTCLNTPTSPTNSTQNTDDNVFYDTEKPLGLFRIWFRLKINFQSWISF